VFYIWRQSITVLYIVIDTIRGGTGEKVTDEGLEDAAKHGLMGLCPHGPYHTGHTAYRCAD